VRALGVSVVVSCGLALAGCGSGTEQAGQPPRRTLTVLAAASLTESFTDLEKEFEAGHPGVDVRLNVAGSSALAQQIANGAPADVFASADQANMDKVTRADLATGPTVFATNRLTIAVAPGNPKRITGLADLGKDGVTLVACAPQVPCGAATGKAATAAGVTLRPASEEQDVKAVLTKVTAGEADAGLVYVTDVAASKGKADKVDFREAGGAVNSYPIVALTGATQPDLAKEFVAFVLGEVGKKELAESGFGAP